ncbi:hypothetical protein K402DRAFT_443207 [Aulographum hederae CBS 113979]|uniref:U6 small nuclear RNA (adenine-(43)-N(6))-methyltransferase n=1 Tax=Aulographum hederae CBS 113979 TaxID=1176131 RepID=A0A6G1HHG5_9PEZI|nr:hypothetical protein K402DRAFT_443207 [Aulographum hederae CBS 113979]
MPPDCYDEEVDFKKLALKDLELAKFVSVNGSIDFRDPDALTALTKALLKRDFGIIIDLPPDRLCPPVPIRYHYIRWIQDLLDTTSSDFDDYFDPNRQVVGVDIGTGASAIYPLLGLSSRANWRFIATEIDEKSAEYAQKNVFANGLSTRCHVMSVYDSSPVIPDMKADFTMCNPPFYDSRAEMDVHRDAKEKRPSAICTGADTEMVCPGGDAGFILRMVEESVLLGDRYQWYTSMFGKWSSVQVVVEDLKKRGVTNWAVGVLKTSGRTMRWVVGWSFRDLRPRDEVARANISGMAGMRALLPKPTELAMKARDPPHVTGQKITAALSQLRLFWSGWQHQRGKMFGVGFALENVWSRSARNRQKKREIAGIEDGEEEVAALSTKEGRKRAVFGFRVDVREEEKEVVVRWLKGWDYVMFESFCGVVKKAVDS